MDKFVYRIWDEEDRCYFEADGVSVWETLGQCNSVLAENNGPMYVNVQKFSLTEYILESRKQARIKVFEQVNFLLEEGYKNIRITRSDRKYVVSCSNSAMCFKY